MFRPTWNEEFRKLNPDPRKMDAKAERLACDVMIDTREKEMMTDPAAQKWEADRKREWKEYRKQMKAKEILHQQQIGHAQMIAQEFLKKRIEINKKKKKKK